MLKANPITSQAFPEFGTAVMMNIINAIGALPTATSSRRTRPGRRHQRPGHHRDHPGQERGLLGLPHGCTRVSKTDLGEGEGPEYETAWAFGAACGVDDLMAITNANFLKCNDLGLDTISAGSRPSPARWN